MGHSYGLPTIKALFAQATHCAYPECTEPLLFEDPSRGVRSIAVQIAHIRSEKPGGPRYDVAFPRQLLNAEENLLLLCGKHHTPVDQNESVFATDELLVWKAAQIAQAGGTVISDTDLANLVRTLESSLSALYEALQVAVTVDTVGGRVAMDGVLVLPLEGLAHLTLPDDADPTRFGRSQGCEQGTSSRGCDWSRHTDRHRRIRGRFFHMDIRWTVVQALVPTSS